MALVFERKGCQVNAKRLGRIAVPALVALMLFVLGLSTSARAVNAPAFTSYASGEFFFPPYPSDSDRMGIGGSVGMYNPALQAGWYTDWSANVNPPHPGGMEYARVVYFQVNTNECGINKIPASQRSQVVESITGTALIDNLRVNPGALWLIGNEPDSIFNCSPIMPELYAELYHEFYTFIKAHDPSARVAIGAIVQPSPLRLEYLDKVLNRYRTLYGEKLPTALWNIHLYAFHEYGGVGDGAGVPPGASSNTGWTYTWVQMVDIDILAQNLRAMRQWMANRGERDKPLIVTEFGQVVPDDGSYWLDGLNFTPQVTRDYLQGSIHHLLTATDSNIGYPADGNRLIQFWAWYSLYDSFYGGDLVYPDAARTLTPAGQAFTQIASQHFVPYVDLYPVPLITPSIPAGSSGPISVSLVVQFDNRGNRAVSSVPVRFAQYDYASGQLLASDLITVSQVFTRYGGVQPQVSAEWVVTPNTQYVFTFEIDPGHTISQSHRSTQYLAYPGVTDLAVTSLTSDLPSAFAWISPVTGTVTATIRNVGNLTSSISTAQFSAFNSAAGTGYLLQDLPVPALAPNASTDISTMLVIPSPGLYVVTATVRYDPDLNMWNNTATFSILAASHWLYLPLMLR